MPYPTVNGKRMRILEKIYRKQILPMITKKGIRWVLSMPGIDKALYALIRRKLVAA